MLAGALILSAAACGGGKAASPAPTSTAVSTATPAPSDLGPPSPQLDRIKAHLRELSLDIGLRPSGSANATKAAAYARSQLEGWGYDVELQPFTVTRESALIYATVQIKTNGRTLPAIVFNGSKHGSASGKLVDGGTGREQDFSDADRGAIVLIQRKDVMFSDMSSRAAAHGAAGVLVANNQEGLFRGTIQPPGTLPFAAIAQADGDALRQLLAKGKVEVSLDVPSAISGTNVIARPKSGTCRTLSGGHYDTVPWAPGGEDNGSGAALVLDLARATASAQIPDACFALWSGEEEGLLGSEYFVSQLTGTEKAGLQAYYNYDVVAGAEHINVIGDQDLSTRVVALGTQAGDQIGLSQLPPGASSDFASFQMAGIPTMMMTVDDLGVLHTERDTFDNAVAHEQPLLPIAQLAFALIHDTSGATPAAP